MILLAVIAQIGIDQTVKARFGEFSGVHMAVTAPKTVIDVTDRPEWAAQREKVRMEQYEDRSHPDRRHEPHLIDPKIPPSTLTIANVFRSTSLLSMNMVNAKPEKPGSPAVEGEVVMHFRGVLRSGVPAEATVWYWNHAGKQRLKIVLSDNEHFVTDPKGEVTAL